MIAYVGMIGGALGNVADRMRIGAVIDYLDLHWRDTHWPAFNLADIFVVGSAALLIWASFRPGLAGARPVKETRLECADATHSSPARMVGMGFLLQTACCPDASLRCWLLVPRRRSRAGDRRWRLGTPLCRTSRPPVPSCG